jgi:hypothetical protein
MLADIEDRDRYCKKTDEDTSVSNFAQVYALLIICQL